MSIGTILLIILIIAPLGGVRGLGGGPFYGTGYYGVGGVSNFEHRAPSWRGSPRICAACANWSQGTVQNCSHCSSYFGLIVRIFFPTASVDVSRIRRSDAMKWSTLYGYRLTHCAPMLPP